MKDQLVSVLKVEELFSYLSNQRSVSYIVRNIDYKTIRLACIVCFLPSGGLKRDLVILLKRYTEAQRLSK